MNETPDESRNKNPHLDIAGGTRRIAKETSPIGTGKRVALYGCGLLLLGLVIITIVIVLTGGFVPFEGTEGVGP